MLLGLRFGSVSKLLLWSCLVIGTLVLASEDLMLVLDLSRTIWPLYYGFSAIGFVMFIPKVYIYVEMEVNKYLVLFSDTVLEAR